MSRVVDLEHVPVCLYSLLLLSMVVFHQRLSSLYRYPVSFTLAIFVLFPPFLIALISSFAGCRGRGGAFDMVVFALTKLL